MDKEDPVKTTAEYEAASAWKPTPTARKIISFVERHDGKPCSKAQIAVALGRNEKTIDRLDGVVCKTNLHKKTATVTFSQPVSDDTLKEIVEKLGYRVTEIR